MTDGFDRLLSVDLAGFSFWAVDAMPDIRLAFTLPNDFVARLSYTAENLRRETYIAGVNARRQSAVQQAQVPHHIPMCLSQPPNQHGLMKNRPMLQHTPCALHVRE